MKKFICIVLLFISLSTSFALGNDYKISLLTCSSGKELYSSFGHSALLVTDTVSNKSAIYNFGLFDFDTPNFYAKFLKGDLEYYLGINSSYSFFESYRQTGRDIYIQDLNLNDSQIEFIISQLNYLNLPENRAYRYQFILRNCTTELRDIIIETIGTDPSILSAKIDQTHREYLNSYLLDKPWSKFGIHLILGSKIDVPIDFYDSMFLPQQLYDGLATLENNNQNLVGESEVILANDADNGGSSSLFYRYYPLLIFLGLLLLTVFCRSRVVDSIILIAIGLLGAFLLFLSLYGGHIEFKVNYNLLWCNPLYLVLAFAILRKKRVLTRILSIIIGLLLVALVIIWLLKIQGFDYSFIIICTMLLWLLFKNNIKGISFS